LCSNKKRAEAEAANRTKDEFLATLSHELRTPLTSILGWIHLIRGGNLDASSASRALETIERNAKSQSQLIDDLLDVSRIITGKLHINIHSINFAAIIEAAVELVRPAAEAKT
jgi:signal transduction histidine kinase